MYKSNRPPPPPENPLRVLRANLRKQVKAMRYHAVEHVAGTTVRHTCKTCGHATERTEIGTPRAVQRLAQYQNQKPGLYGVCDRCTRALRDERYPLKPIAKTPG